MKWTQNEVFRLGLLALLVLLTLPLVNTRGTTDVLVWETWASKVQSLGAIQGYRAISADYPPLASLILGLAVHGGSLIGLSPIVSIKASLLIALLASTAFFWTFTRHYWGTILFIAALSLHSVGHGYLDVYYCPLIICAFAALTSERYFLFGTCYTLACFVKWQPAIIGPFIMLHLLRTLWLNPLLQDGRRQFALHVCLPAFMICLMMLVLYEAYPLVHALSATFRTHRALSLQALNLPWVVSHVLEVIQPERFGGLRNGEGQILRFSSEAIQALSRLPFFAVYTTCFYMVLKARLSAMNTVIGCFAGYFSYFMINTGVHENHFFLVAVLALFLLAFSTVSMETAVCVSLMLNANLLVFYGLDGISLRFARCVGGLDVALVLAAANVIFYSMILITLLRRLHADRVGSPPDHATLFAKECVDDKLRQS